MTGAILRGKISENPQWHEVDDKQHHYQIMFPMQLMEYLIHRNPPFGNSMVKMVSAQASPFTEIFIKVVLFDNSAGNAQSEFAGR